MMPRVGFIVFGCLTKPKYKQQLIDCWNTWASDALEYGCSVWFYTGHVTPEDLPQGMATKCIDCGYDDSYFSATFKQWVGLDDSIIRDPECDFYFLCGTDTYVRIPELLQKLRTIDATQELQLGGSFNRTAYKGIQQTYFSGGAGILLTRPAALKLQPHIESFLQEWIDTAHEPVPVEHPDGTVWAATILFACDVGLGVLCNRLEIKSVELGDWLMYGAGNHKSSILEPNRWISCHLMSHEDFEVMRKQKEFRIPIPE
jgi:hypothetical protein